MYIVKSFVEIVQYLLKIPGAKYFLSEQISQDPLEKFFGIQRQRGRTGDNPTVSQFCKNTQAIRLINSVCANVKGNCRGREQSIDMEDIKPLPKRRRVRKSSCSKSNAENKDPLLHNRPTPAQKVVSSPELTSAIVQQVITPAVSAPVQQVVSSPVSTPVKLVALPPPDCPIVSLPLPVPIPTPQPVLSPILPLDQSVVDQPAAASAQSILVQVSSLFSECGKAEEIISKHQGIVLRRQDLWTLNNHRWLDDQVSFTQEF